MSAFAALGAFRPSEPFLVTFLTCAQGLTHLQITREVFPVWSYGYLILLPICCGFAEVFGHRQVVLFGAIGRTITALLLLCPRSANSVLLMQISQVAIAAGFAAHPALSAIMFRGTSKEHYVRAVGVVASVGVLAEVAGSILGQLLLARGVISLYTLFTLSALSTAAAFVVGCWLPTRQRRPAYAAPRLGDSVHCQLNALAEGPARQPLVGAGAGDRTLSYSGDRLPGEEVASVEAASVVARRETRLAKAYTKAGLVFSDTVHLLRHSGALRYYGWISVATAAHHLVVTYWQAAIPAAEGTSPMAQEAGSTGGDCDHPDSSVNGYYQATASLLGGLAALLPMAAEKWLGAGVYAATREWLMALSPLALALLVYAMSTAASIPVYGWAYILFHVVFECMRVMCDAEGARSVASTRVRGAPRFAAVSGINTTMCLMLQVLLQTLFNRVPLQAGRLNLQFRMLSALFVALFAVYSCVAVGRWCGRVLQARREQGVGVAFAQRVGSDAFQYHAHADSAGTKR